MATIWLRAPHLPQRTAYLHSAQQLARPGRQWGCMDLMLGARRALARAAAVSVAEPRGIHSPAGCGALAEVKTGGSGGGTLNAMLLLLPWARADTP